LAAGSDIRIILTRSSIFTLERCAIKPRQAASQYYGGYPGYGYGGWGRGYGGWGRGYGGYGGYPGYGYRPFYRGYYGGGPYGGYGGYGGTCAPNEISISNTCYPISGIGGPCVNSAQCQSSGAYCRNGVCVSNIQYDNREFLPAPMTDNSQNTEWDLAASTAGQWDNTFAVGVTVPIMTTLTDFPVFEDLPRKMSHVFE
ncbi:hypothetical protein TELCIR_06489, partial [Teladorsagia circumcincta]